MQHKLCILAGGGRLPALLIEACEQASRPFVVFAIKGQAKAGDFEGISSVHWHRLGAGRSIVNDLKRLEVKNLILAGSIRRPGLLQLLPDPWTLAKALRSRAMAKGDDGLLRVVAAIFEEQGIQVIGVPDVAPSLLTPNGVLTSTAPSASGQADIEVARSAARELGRKDIGQAVVARNGRVVAREDRRGTDAMLISISGQVEGGGVLAKCVKPGQDRRLDLPAIGVNTVRYAHDAGLAGIVVDAGASLIIDRDATIAAANDVGLFIVGASDE